MNITSDITTKMVPQKSIKVNIELTEEEAAAFVKYYGCSSWTTVQPITKALFLEIDKALVKAPVDEDPVKPKRPYPTGTKVKFLTSYLSTNYEVGVVKEYNACANTYVVSTDVDYTLNNELVQAI